MDRHNLPKNFQDWLVEELEKCIPGHLRLLYDIYYFWLGTDKHTRDERTRPRKAILDRARDQFASLPVEKFIESFDPSFPYTLFHLIFTSDYEKPTEVPYGSLSDWAWIGPILLRAIEIRPDEMMPQAIISVSADAQRRSERLTYAFDEERVRGLFGNRSEDFFNTVARGFQINTELNAQDRQRMELAIQAAKQRKSGARSEAA
jgi:hypothetical protein